MGEARGGVCGDGRNPNFGAYRGDEVHPSIGLGLDAHDVIVLVLRRRYSLYLLSTMQMSLNLWRRRLLYPLSTM